MKGSSTCCEHGRTATVVREVEGGEADDKPPPAVVCGLRPVKPEARAASTRNGTLSSSEAWDDWLWQLRHRIRSIADLKEWVAHLAINPGMIAAAEKFPLAITPYYASLMRVLDRRDPIFSMCVPTADELRDPPFLVDDPLAEDSHMPVPGLVHRYRDRALVLATTACAVYCRHCTRKRVAGQTESYLSAVNLTRITEYLSVHPEIHDVVISGGDPFIMRTSALERVVRAVRAVPTVEIIRIGTRTPVVLPMRITEELVQMLRRYHPVYVNTHFNHPIELTPEAEAACMRLVDAGIPVANQTVLLRGVNDNPQVMAELFRRLVRVRVRPYYLFQCDLVRGVEHFRTPLAKGIEIMEYLRGRLSGLAIPTFVVDTPGGKGKVPLLPNYVVSTSPTHTVLRNYAGELVSYPEPYDGKDRSGESCATPGTEGVWDLACGRISCLSGRKSNSGAGTGH
ncbi:MAG: KamA family radical SAM protein [Kiritimatiellia bacterium]